MCDSLFLFFFFKQTILPCQTNIKKSNTIQRNAMVAMMAMSVSKTGNKRIRYDADEDDDVELDMNGLDLNNRGDLCDEID